MLSGIPRQGLWVLLVLVTLASPLVLLPGCGDAVGQAGESEPAPPQFELDRWPFSETALRGRKVYELWCVGCHGQQADGQGEAAAFLDPVPRNFQKGLFKFRSTPSSRLPTLEDLMHVIKCGLNGSSMPAFPLVKETDRKDVAQYVLEVALFGKAREEINYVVESEGVALDEVVRNRLPDIKKQVFETYESESVAIVVPPYPEPTEESIAKGRERYLRECGNCHGLTGRGDGGSAYTMRDWKGAAILPRDFTTGVMRAGSTPADIYRRLKTGANGTPMPAITGTDADLWALVHFIQSLRDPKAPRPKLGCDAEGHQ